MAILFLCGSLESGQDGVGDYTRRLADSLNKIGIKVSLIAFNDRKITDLLKEPNNNKNYNLPILRLPSNLLFKERYTILKEFIKETNPTWISIQYVGFSFNNYGLPLHFLFNLKKEIKSIKIHIMFHELWCGMPKSAGSKEKFLGILQKIFIKSFIYTLAPEKISTNINSYQIYLKKIGIEADVVPIFGNISNSDYPLENEWKSIVVNLGLEELLNPVNNWLILGFFGSIYPMNGLSELISNALDAAKLTNKQLALISIGHNRGTKVEDLSKNLGPISVWKIGPLPSILINKILTLINLGVVTTPADGINKSGTAIAYMERSIPIILSGKDKSYNKAELEPLGVIQVHSAEDVIKALSSKETAIYNDRFKETTNYYSQLN